MISMFRLSSIPLFRLTPQGGGGLSDCSVTSAHIQDSAIIAGDIADSAITSIKIADSAIVSADIQDCGIQTGDIVDCGITSAKIADSTIVTLDLADCAVTNAKLGDTAVVTGKINNAAVTYAKIQNVTAARLLGRHDATAAGVTQEISLTGGLSFDSTAGTISSDSVVAASLTASGRSEHATSAEINLATDTLRVHNVFTFAQSNYGTRIVQLLITDTTLATGDSQFHFFIPPEMDSWDLIDADAAVATASTAGEVTVQLRNVTDAADMLSTKITIDSGEKTSYTAATAPVIDTNNDSVITGNEIAVDIDSAGNAEGLNIIMQFRHRGA